jgi:myo-inositol-1(or 4)-monophosphatase
MSPSTNDWKAIIDRALPIVAEAAAFIRSQAGLVKEDAVETKSRNSLVSYVDLQAEKMLVEGLQQIIPESGFITEESTIDQQHSAYTWIIDPLDGTTNFLQQIPFYCVSVALAFENTIVVGIVHDVERDEVFYAWKGGGAWCRKGSEGKGQGAVGMGNRDLGKEESVIHVSSRNNVGDTVVATGFPYASRDVYPQLTAVFDFFLKNARGIRRLGSAALDLAYVACARVDVYYETSLNEWDIAAGILLVEEAGGKVSDFASRQDMLQNGQIIAANAHVHAAVVNHIRTIFGT